MKTILLPLSLLLAAALNSAAVSLPHVFGDGMVLQRGRRVPVWGKGAPGEVVTVSFAGQEASATTGPDGRWRLDLAPLDASAVGADFVVRGDNAITFTDVVVGEVWFCSGQSNMEYPVGPGLPWARSRVIKDSEREIAAANYPLLRHFNVARRTSNVPLDDVGAKWEPTTPETIVPQSAVAYTFGETLHKALGVPVGLINCSWGGTRIEAWTPAGHPDDLWLLQNIRKWDRAHDVPTALWNGMVAGLVPFAIQGAIWYQGCSNRADGDAYLDKTVSLVRGWRREWGQGDFPYFLVQLAPYSYGNVKDTSLARIQEAQARVETRVPNSGYVVINDVGDVNDIHPTDKRTVGERLAWQALDRVYDTFVKPWKSPVARGMSVEGPRVRVSFDNADGLRTRDGLAPTEFEIRDLLGAWVPATAQISGSDVILAAEGVESPLGVRFAPYNGSTPNLVNGDGLPAGPFRFSSPCPLGAAERVPEAAGFVCVQRYDIPVNCDFRKNLPKTVATVEEPARVGYLLELQDADGDTAFAFASMDAWAATTGEMVLRGPEKMPDVRVAVSNLTVASNMDGVRTSGPVDGFVEFYGSNYAPRNTGTPPGANAQKYDFDDTPQPEAVQGPGFGCLQVHDMSRRITVLAFNHFNNAGVACDVGIGPGRGENPDWTHSRNAGAYAARRISVWMTPVQASPR